MIIAPFKNVYFWTDTKLYSINWIITTFFGALIGYIISIINNLSDIESAYNLYKGTPQVTKMTYKKE